MRVVTARPAAYCHETIRLEATDIATFRINVPWFPEGLWVVDIPEGHWGPFPGANDWPLQPRHRWLTHWQTNEPHTAIRYRRRRGSQSLAVEVTAAGDVVRMRISPRGLGRISLGSICIKTLNPFFSSQERLTQHRIRGERLVPALSLPLRPDWAVPFGWWVGTDLEYGAVVMRALDGSGYVAILGPNGCGGGGNGWPHCTHLTGPRLEVETDTELAMLFHLGTDERRLIGRVRELAALSES